MILIEEINAGKQKDTGSPPLTHYHWDTAELHCLHSAHVHTLGKGLEVHKIVSNCQHGFVRNRSCQNSLISFNDNISGFVAKRETVDVTLVYLDLSVSFCTVSHDTLIERLRLLCPGETSESLDTGLQKTILREQWSLVQHQLGARIRGTVWASVLCCLLLNKDWVDKWERMAAVFSYKSKLRRIANVLDGRASIQKNVNGPK